MPAVNNNVLSSESCVKRVDFQLRSYHKPPPPQQKPNGQEATLGGDGFVYYLDQTDDFANACIYSNLSDCTHEVGTVRWISITLS